MPVSKKRPNITELLNFAVEQRQKVQETKIDILQRPASIWTHRAKIVPISEIHNESGKERKEAAMVHKLFGRCPDWMVLLSRRCEKIYENILIRGVRILVTMLAGFVLAHEAPSVSFSNEPTAYVILEHLVNAWFLVDSFICLCGVPIRVKIEEAFQREVTAHHVFIHSGIFSTLVACVCFGLGQSIEGVWFHLLRFLLMTSALLDFMPHIDVLMSGIGNGLKSILFTILLLFVTIFIYGVIGHLFFQKNDPFHFGTILLSIWSFFQIATFDEWTPLFYVNFKGCDAFPTEYVVYDGVDQTDVYEAFPNVANPFDKVHTYMGEFYLPICSHPMGEPVAAVILFASFIFLGGYCMMSLNLAAVAIGINERLEQLRTQELYGAGDNEEKKITATVTKKRETIMPDMGKNSKAAKMTGGALRTAEMKKMLNKIWAEDGHDDDNEHNMLSLHTLTDWRYKVFINLCMLAEVVLEASEISGHGNGSSSNSTKPEYLAFHVIFQLFFTMDVCFSVAAFQDNDLRKQLLLSIPTIAYEAVITLCIWLPTISPTTAYFPIIGLLRVVRLSTILKNMGYVLHDLQIILQAFASSIFGLSYVLCLVGFFFFYYAVAGTILFKHSDPYSFGTVFTSLMSLLQVMTLDNMNLMMRRNMLGCAAFGYSNGLDKFDDLCDIDNGKGLGWISALYFASFVILGAMVLISLLVGVIITSMELLREDVLECEEIWKEVDVVKDAFELGNTAVKMMLVLFEKIDDNSDSTISFQELQPLMFAIDIAETDQSEFFGQGDRDDSGQIDFAEFCEIVSIIGFALKKTPFSRKDIVDDVDPMSVVVANTSGTRERAARAGTTRQAMSLRQTATTVRQAAAGDPISTSRRRHDDDRDSSNSRISRGRSRGDEESSSEMRALSSLVRTYRNRDDSCRSSPPVATEKVKEVIGGQNLVTTSMKAMHDELDKLNKLETVDAKIGSEATTAAVPIKQSKARTESCYMEAVESEDTFHVAAVAEVAEVQKVHNEGQQVMNMVRNMQDDDTKKKSRTPLKNKQQYEMNTSAIELLTRPTTSGGASGVDSTNAKGTLLQQIHTAEIAMIAKKGKSRGSSANRNRDDSSGGNKCVSRAGSEMELKEL